MEAPEDMPKLQTVTSASLLEGLKNADNHTRWRGYVDRYRPLIVSFSLARGLKHDEAEDFAQTVLLEFSRAYREGHYDAEKGRLRSWLFGIVDRQLLNFRRHKARGGRRVVPLKTEHIAQFPDDVDLEARWEEEWRKALLHQTLVEIRAIVDPRTFAAFEEFALKERPAAEVADELGITRAAVFGCKRRVLQRLREILPLMEEAW